MVESEWLEYAKSHLFWIHCMLQHPACAKMHTQLRRMCIGMSLLPCLLVFVFWFHLAFMPWFVLHEHSSQGSVSVHDVSASGVLGLSEFCHHICSTQWGIPDVYIPCSSVLSLQQITVAQLSLLNLHLCSCTYLALLAAFSHHAWLIKFQLIAYHMGSAETQLGLRAPS